MFLSYVCLLPHDLLFYQVQGIDKCLQNIVYEWSIFLVIFRCLHLRLSERSLWKEGTFTLIEDLLVISVSIYYFYRGYMMVHFLRFIIYVPFSSHSIHNLIKEKSYCRKKCKSVKVSNSLSRYCFVFSLSFVLHSFDYRYNLASLDYSFKIKFKSAIFSK